MSLPIIKNRLISVCSATLVFAISVLVIAGWIFDLPHVRSLLPGLPTMVPMTATQMVFLSISLCLSWLLTRQHSGNKLRLITTIVLLVPIFISCFNVFELIFELNSFLLQIFLTESVAHDNSILYAGKMSVQTSVATAFMAGSMLIVNYNLARNKNLFYLKQVFLFLTATLGTTALIGYLHDITKWGPSSFIGVSLPTAICLLMLVAGVIFLEPDHGLLKILRKPDAAGLFLRWYISFGILFPIISSAVIQWGENLTLYPEAVGSTLFVLLNIILLLAMGIGMAIGIRRWEQQRLETEKAMARVVLEATEESLQETKQSLEFALLASDMGTIERGLLHTSLKVGGNTRVILDLSDEDMVSSEDAVMARIHADDVKMVSEVREKAIRERTDMNVDFRYYWRDGTMHWVRFKGRAKYNSKGIPFSLNGTLVDVTAEKQYQVDLETALKVAESANSLKSSFLANMSHEIRTPLGAILGFTDLLLDPSLEHEERSRYLKVIQRNGDSLSRLINDILDLSKVESGHLDVEKIPVSVKSLVNEVISLLEVRAKEKDIYLVSEFLTTPPDLIVTDPTRVKQILVNLVGNALKFTDKGGVRLGIRSSKGEIQFFVEDTGVGVDMSQKDKLFKPFSQADSSTTRVFGGTGLGLALSSKLADLLGGKIQLISSTIGKGSVFLFTMKNLREISAEPVAAKKTTAPAEQKLKDYKILMCEDSPDIQKLLRLVLRKEGVIFDLANNGLEGFEKAMSGDHDIVLMDIQMPVLDGYLATKNLREAGYKKPIVALTAHAMSDERERCFAVGCNEYLSKPIDREKLINTIYRLVEKENS
jgi:signal transduction histidine kinase/ActR/RegA family two-component response regulator